ncbi:MAG: hypothetical protein IJH39_05745 [Clostridia bacterium]|nr:hypothetical protein [Clostridia bacterium]
MKVAKADKEEFDKVYDFINVMDSLFDGRFWSHEEEWKEWDDDNPNKKLLLKIEEEIRESDGETIWDCVDNRLILYEFMKRKWMEANWCGSFQRIVTNAEVLIDNACDTNLDYLEWKPEIKEAIEKYEQEKSSE